jgi:hypothetical protein
MKFEVVMQSNMEGTVFWDVMPCIPVDRYQHFGGTCCLCHEGRRALNVQALHPVFICGIFITEAVSQNNKVPYTIFIQVSTACGVRSGIVVKALRYKLAGLIPDGVIGIFR